MEAEAEKGKRRMRSGLNVDAREGVGLRHMQRRIRKWRRTEEGGAK